VKPPSPLVGYNDNVLHQGRVFHVQTEDAGARRGYVVTHLFADGGRVVKTAKQPYPQQSDGEERVAELRALMRHQHEAMIAAVQGGELDAALDGSPVVEAPEQPSAAPRQGFGARLVSDRSLDQVVAAFLAARDEP